MINNTILSVLTPIPVSTNGTLLGVPVTSTDFGASGCTLSSSGGVVTAAATDAIFTKARVSGFVLIEDASGNPLMTAPIKMVQGQSSLVLDIPDGVLVAGMKITKYALSDYKYVFIQPTTGNTLRLQNQVIVSPITIQAGQYIGPLVVSGTGMVWASQ